MQIRIDNASSRPVYQQIMDHIKRDIALGRLAWGEKLPTVRQLAARLAINPNTIAKAYRRLEQEGIITTKPGAGTFVANLDSNLSEAVKKRIISAELERITVEAFHMQIDARSLCRWFNDAVEKFNIRPPKPRSGIPRGGKSNE
jgi:GntR family transcriptional regulator